MFQMLGPAEASCVLAWPFVKYRLHDGQDCVDYATGPTAEEWLNLTGFYKKIFDAAGGRFKWFLRFKACATSASDGETGAAANITE